MPGGTSVQLGLENRHLLGVDNGLSSLNGSLR